MKSGKVWGETHLILKTPMVEIHKLIISPKSHCSWHKHQFKWNAFLVVSGVLMIEVRKNDYALTDTTTLWPGDLCTVKPGEVHRFRTVAEEPCQAWEIYYPEPLAEDIIRESVGGHEE